MVSLFDYRPSRIKRCLLERRKVQTFRLFRADIRKSRRKELEWSTPCSLSAPLRIDSNYFMPRDDFEEKSHYSYDEMIDRLKESRSGRSSSGGKKRRRSEQDPVENPRNLKLIAIISAVLVVLGLAIPVAIFMMSRGQYTTDAFRRSLNDRGFVDRRKSRRFRPISDARQKPVLAATGNIG